MRRNRSTLEDTPREPGDTSSPPPDVQRWPLRNVLLIAVALLALTPARASPVGIELAWNACFGRGGAQGMVASSCDADTGSQSMFASFWPPAGVDRLEGVEVFIDYQVPGGYLPCWWNFSVGQTRRVNLIPLHVSPTDANGVPLIPCDNHYFLNAGADGGGGMIVTGADRGQLKGIAAIAAGTGLPVTANAQQYGVGFRITNGNTTSGTCAGCQQRACFALNTINLTSLGVQNVVMQSPHPGSEYFIAWQPGNPYLCFTPVQSRTWGAIKSIYR